MEMLALISSVFGSSFSLNRLAMYFPMRASIALDEAVSKHLSTFCFFSEVIREASECGMQDFGLCGRLCERCHYEVQIEDC